MISAQSETESRKIKFYLTEMMKKIQDFQPYKNVILSDSFFCYTNILFWSAHYQELVVTFRLGWHVKYLLTAYCLELKNSNHVVVHKTHVIYLSPKP
jgi:hypothetical protein